LRTIGRILARLIVASIGYVIACLAVGAAISGTIVANAWLGGEIATPMAHLTVESLFFGGVLASLAAVHGFAPAVLAIVVSEVFGIRGPLYHVLCGGLAGALGHVAASPPAWSEAAGALDPAVGGRLPLFVAAGLIGGFVYWLVAGRGAGVLREPAA
jgi:hypothetical protein